MNEMIRYQFGEQATEYNETHQIVVSIDKPRGDWTTFHFSVHTFTGSDLQDGARLLEGQLTEDVVRSLKGIDGNMHTCASVYHMLEKASEDLDDCTVFEDIK